MDIAGAREVELASYVYDDEEIQKILCRRLRDSSTFSLNVYIDKEKFGGTIPRSQKPRLRDLARLGAQVFVCAGAGSQGAFHVKGVVVDRRALYTGSANLTRKSRDNEEICFRITGPTVQAVLERLARQRQNRSPWDGQ